MLIWVEVPENLSHNLLVKNARLTSVATRVPIEWKHEVAAGMVKKVALLTSYIP